MKSKYFLIPIIFALSLGGCASGPEGGAESPRVSKKKQPQQELVQQFAEDLDRRQTEAEEIEISIIMQGS